MKIGFKETDSKEYRCIAMAMYSFIIFMLFFALCRLCGWFWFSVEYKPIEVSYVLYAIISYILKAFDFYIILWILISKKIFVKIILSLVGTLIIFAMPPVWQFIADIIFMFSVPFIFNVDKAKSILKSGLLVLLVSIYQILMSFSRYNMTFDGKWDIGYALLSMIDYRFFMLILGCYFSKRRIKNVW